MLPGGAAPLVGSSIIFGFHHQRSPLTTEAIRRVLGSGRRSDERTNHDVNVERQDITNHERVAQVPREDRDDGAHLGSEVDDHGDEQHECHKQCDPGVIDRHGRNAGPRRLRIAPRARPFMPLRDGGEHRRRARGRPLFPDGEGVADRANTDPRRRCPGTHRSPMNRPGQTAGGPGHEGLDGSSSCHFGAMGVASRMRGLVSSSSRGYHHAHWTRD
jgi:hypothetical protein